MGFKIVLVLVVVVVLEAQWDQWDLVHRVMSRRHTVGFKRVWMRGLSEEHPTPLFTLSCYSWSFPGWHEKWCGTEGTNNDAAGPFSTHPSGPRPVGWFSVRRPPDSLDPYQFRYGRFARALKNSQLIRRLPDDVTIICETVH